MAVYSTFQLHVHYDRIPGSLVFKIPLTVDMSSTCSLDLASISGRQSLESISGRYKIDVASTWGRHWGSTADVGRDRGT